MEQVKMYGYLRHSSLKAHEVPGASAETLSKELYWIANDWRDDPEWPCVAMAVMTITPLATDEFVAAQVALLRKQAQEVRAQAEVKAQGIERDIQSLLAISHNGR
jgi:hypothetical protein